MEIENNRNNRENNMESSKDEENSLERNEKSNTIFRDNKNRK